VKVNQVEIEVIGVVEEQCCLEVAGTNYFDGRVQTSDGARYAVRPTI
jgi:hypothetical protein